MTKKKGTKRALLMSVLSLVLCFSMLIGTTFAWFTDSVTSASNIIKSGNLDVEMYWAEGTEDPTNANWIDASTGAIFDYQNWEPGYTMVRHIKIENKGSLALKYKVVITTEGTISDLTDVIDVYYEDPAMQMSDASALTEEIAIGNLTSVLANMDATANGALAAGASDTITIALKMRETAGNDYQNKQIGAFSISLLATQYSAEDDNFGSDYDLDATYPVVSSNLKNLMKDDEGNDDNVSGVIFGTYEQYGSAVEGVVGEDAGDGVTLYRVPDVTTFAATSDTTYTLYFLSDSKILLAGDATGLFRDMKGLTVFDGSNLDMSQVTSTQYLFRDSTNLTEIIGAEDWDLSNVTSTRGMFYKCSKLEKLDVSKWDVSKVENAGWMFYECKAITELDVSNWVTSSMTFAKSMFCSNEKLTELDLSGWDMSNVTNSSYMFFRCYELSSDSYKSIENWDVSSIETFESMFKHAYGMTELDLSKWETSSATDMNHMFANIGKNLTSLDLSSFDTSKVTSMAWMFYDCNKLETIYVGDGWTTAALDPSNPTCFYNNQALIGGQGTKWLDVCDMKNVNRPWESSAKLDFAIVDGGESNPGLLSYKAN